jgi:D-beta-D-heptose 7-phosphate kinase/D-beta-D-heptose 1-phosphate adenosyltransferase
VLDEDVIRNITQAPIMVVGDVMVDEYVVGNVDRISPESPVPVLVARDRLRRLGGAGNVVANLVSQGATVALVATIGADNAGDWFRRHCEELGVETFWLKELDSRPTTIKTRVVAKHQQIVRIDEEHLTRIPPEIENEILPAISSVMAQVKAVIVSDYGKGLLTPRILDAVMSSAKENDLPVLVDPKGLDYRRYRGATYLTPNTREASLASGIDIVDSASIAEAGGILLDQADAKGVVLTRGREGCTLITRDRIQNFPVEPVEIIDVTGAGDTVAATLTLALANGLSIQSAIRMSNIAASLVVSRFGAATVTLQEIMDRINSKTPDTKTVNFGKIGSLLRSHRMQGKKIVFTNGCFDLFHAGHLETLRQASAMGDVLVVGINSDKSVASIKGKGRPIISQSYRAELVTSLSFVDYAVLFDEDTPLELIKEVRPDVLVKGEDWKGKKVVGAEIVKARGGRVEFIRHLSGISTSEIIEKIRREV